MPPMIKDTPSRTENPVEEKIRLGLVNQLEWRKNFSCLEYRLKRKGFCGQVGGLIHIRPGPLSESHFQQLWWLKCKGWVKFGILTTMIPNLTSACILLCET